MSPINGQVDLAVQLHFALFNGSDGFLLKPPEMLTSFPPAESSLSTDLPPASCSTPLRSDQTGAALQRAGSNVLSERSKTPLPVAPPANRPVCKAASAESIMIADHFHHHDADVYWPPARERLHRTSMKLLSLHNTPQVHARSRSAPIDLDLGTGPACPHPHLHPSANASLLRSTPLRPCSAASRDLAVLEGEVHVTTTCVSSVAQPHRQLWTAWFRTRVCCFRSRCIPLEVMSPCRPLRTCPFSHLLG